jgi:hypothetical protein
MRLTIIAIDKCVYKDNISYTNLISIDNAPNNLHALQWNNSEGWIEFNDGQPNQVITELPAWTTDIINEWDKIHTNALNAESISNINIPQSTLTDAQRMAIIVDDRNKRLLASDWTQLPDVINLHDDVWLNNWKTYRQALRDLPANVDIKNPFFPIPPL